MEKVKRGIGSRGRGGQKTRVQIWRLWTMAMAGVGDACQASLLCCVDRVYGQIRGRALLSWVRNSTTRIPQNFAERTP